MKLLAFLAALPLSLALTFTIPSSHILPSPSSSLPSSTKLTLTRAGTHYTALLRRDGTFQFADVLPGEYLVEVVTRDFHFEPLGVIVSTAESSDGITGKKESKATEAWITFRGNEWKNKGEKVLKANGDVELRVIAPKAYYTQRPKFNPADLFKNWMMIGAVVSCGLAFGIPYLIDQMDPEMKAEFEAQQKLGPLAAIKAAALGEDVVGQAEKSKAQIKRDRRG